MKRAFTLIELLIVIGIIAILAGVLINQMGGATESAKLAKCQSNIRALASGAIAYAVETGGTYPDAVSHQTQGVGAGSHSRETVSRVSKAWISPQDQGVNWGRTSGRYQLRESSMFGTEAEVTYALTNGALWQAVGCNREVYTCPVHAKTCEKLLGKRPGWSYAMNLLFGMSTVGKLTRMDGKGTPIPEDRTLMFAELPGLDDSKVKASKYKASRLPKLDLSSENSTDGALYYQHATGGSEDGASETMGFNHVRNGRLVGVVAFADGHIEAIQLPKNGNFTALTGWLCEGYDIVRNGENYTRVVDGSQNTEAE